MKYRIVGWSVAGSLALAAAGTNAAIDNTKANELLTRGGCLACHTPDKKGVFGPSFEEIAVKNRKRPDAHAEVVRKVRQGVTGTYGNRAMPAISRQTISDTDLSDIVEWILSK